MVKRSEYWNDEWFKKAVDVEDRLGRPICGAKSKRTGEPCKRRPGPNGRCYLHGGRNKGPPPSSFLYSKVTKRATELIGRASRVIEDRELRNLEQDLSVLRALCSLRIESFEQACNKLSTYEDGLNNREMSTVGDETRKRLYDEYNRETAALLAITREIVRTITRIEKIEIEREYVLRLNEVEALLRGHLGALIDAVVRLVRDPEVINRIREEYSEKVRYALGKSTRIYLPDNCSDRELTVISEKGPIA